MAMQELAHEAAAVEHARPAQTVEEDKRVTALELFFDLVFVFAITQVTGFVSADPTWTRLLEGVAMLAVLWFAWSGYAWLGNTADADEGRCGIMLLAAMGAMLIASLAVPHAFGRTGSSSGSRTSPSAYCTSRPTRWSHARARTPSSRRVVGPAGVDDAARRGAAGPRRAHSTACPAALLDCGARGRLRRHHGARRRGLAIIPGHFAERHGLIMIIALGESIVSLGVGAEARARHRRDRAALLGMVVAAALWWAYFDVVAIVAERRLRSGRRARAGADRARLLHLPAPADDGRHRPVRDRRQAHADRHSTRTSPLVPASALCGGVALYLVALSAFKRRNIGTFNRPAPPRRGLLLAMFPLATAVPALLALGLVTAAACGLIAYEVIRYNDARYRIRHVDTD